MKKATSLFIVLAMIAAMMTSLVVFAAESGEEKEYVRFTSGDFDPYGTFYFSENGNNAEIDADLVRYAAIRYRTITAETRDGLDVGGQFYVQGPSLPEPYIPIIYQHTQKWETAIVDMTTISVTKEGMESLWSADCYTNADRIRLDPIEPNRENPIFVVGEDNGKVKDASQIDIAWIAFFEKEEDAKAYTGNEKTPYCLLDAEALANGQGLHNMTVERFEDETAVVSNTVKVNVKDPNPTPIEITGKYLDIKTCEVPEGNIMTEFILIGCPTWNNAAENSDAEALAYVWTGDVETTLQNKPVAQAEVINHKDNLDAKFKFDNPLRYGHEYLIEITTTNEGKFGFYTASELPETWTVLLDDEEIETVPSISYTLETAGEIADYVLEKPQVTEAPAEATAEPTEAPAEATKVPEETSAPAKETEAPEKKGCGSSAIGIGALTALLGAALVTSKKKN